MIWFNFFSSRFKATVVVQLHSSARISMSCGDGPWAPSRCPAGGGGGWCAAWPAHGTRRRRGDSQVHLDVRRWEEGAMGRVKLLSTGVVLRRRQYFFVSMANLLYIPRTNKYVFLPWQKTCVATPSFGVLFYEPWQVYFIDNGNSLVIEHGNF